MNPDEGYNKLDIIYKEFGQFCSKRGQVSEADTRIKIIDRILKEVLGWNEGMITRENPVHKGFLDYIIAPNGGRGAVVIEAKKEGASFDVAIKKNLMRMKLNGSIRSNKELYEAIEQAHYYCVEQAIRFAVVTNGYSWVIFRASRDDIPWREGFAIIFSSAGIIKDNFIDFWNLLSPYAIQSGLLESTFSSAQLVNRKLLRVIDYLFYPDQPMLRNRLHNQLSPIVNRIFGDIAEDDQIEILQRCYIHSKTLKIIDENLKLLVTDTIPHFALNDGTIDIKTGENDAGEFGQTIGKILTDPQGDVLLLLGGIGAGKSTFLKRFFKFVGKDLIDRTGCWFYITFLHPPEKDKMENFVYEKIIEQIRSRYEHEKLLNRESILEAFKPEIDELNDTIFNAEQLDDKEYQRRLSSYIELWKNDLPKYVQALLKLLRSKGKSVIICIDNLDQLSPDYQNQIFLYSQRLTNEVKSITIMALREESFYSASIQRTFSAYTNRKFHISSPSFRVLIGQRLKYAREVLTFPDQRVQLILRSGNALDKNQINNFLAIIEDSLFRSNRNIARFIECISSGNMREALDMFASFLYSGSTDVDKMLAIYEKQGNYFVAFHEFAKAIILGDRRFYRESSSKGMNLFDCGAERNSSHFTSLRILNYLLVHQGTNSPEGRGFVEIEYVLGAFIDVMDNEEDFFRTANRLLKKSLIEVDTRATDSIKNSICIRITASGWYYASFLSKSFSYLDLMLQDTPINEEVVVNDLTDLVRKVDAIVDNEQTKREKLELRFQRVNIFLEYLEKEEIHEREYFGLESNTSPLGREIMKPIKEQFKKEMSNIKRKLSSLFNPIEDEDEIPEIPGGLEIITDISFLGDEEHSI
jgi:hypothetical protein